MGDRAEAEADRVAAAVVDRLAPVVTPGPATGRVARGTWPPAVRPPGPPPVARVARATWQPTVRSDASGAAGVIRRAPYLHNGDARIYRDSKQGDAEFAYLGKFEFLGDAQVFVPYTAVHDLQDLVDELGRNLTRPKRKHAGPYDRPASRSRSKSIGGKTGYALDLGDNYRGVSERVRGVVGGSGPGDARDDALLRKNLKAALKGVYGWYGGDDWQDLTRQLPPAKLGTIIMAVIDRGAGLMAQAGGSRLPPASGTVYSTPPRVADEIFRVLGVPPDNQSAYADITIKGLQPEAYAAERDRLTTGGANIFPLEDVSSGTWMFYESTATTGRSSNSRIQVGGRSFTDADFAALDPVADAALLAQLATGYRQLRITADTGWIDGTEMTASRDRGPGQAKAMKLWNALGAAAYSNRFHGTAYDLAQNWEWLHVRGAQIGGQTVMGNLVPGFYTTNSAMIPFENMIKDWATADPHRFQARFQALGVAGVFAQTIRLSIRAVAALDPSTGTSRGHVTLGEVEHPLLDFDPLGGRVVDRLAGVFVKRQLDFTFRV